MASTLSTTLSWTSSSPLPDLVALNAIFSSAATNPGPMAIATGLALELHQKYGTKPVVTISENRPYVLAILFATWKLGGVFVPLDYHVPREILECMLFNIAPTCVLEISKR